MEQLKHCDSDSFIGGNKYELVLPSLASYYLHERSLLMSWHNIILPFFLAYLSQWAPNAHCLVADDAFTLTWVSAIMTEC